MERVRENEGTCGGRFKWYKMAMELKSGSVISLVMEVYISGSGPSEPFSDLVAPMEIKRRPSCIIHVSPTYCDGGLSRSRSLTLLLSLSFYISFFSLPFAFSTQFIFFLFFSHSPLFPPLSFVYTCSPLCLKRPHFFLRQYWGFRIYILSYWNLLIYLNSSKL